MKKPSTRALSICFILLLLSLTFASCDQTVPELSDSEGLGYLVNEDGISCTVTGMGTCTDTEVGIPETIDGYTVTRISRGAFYDNAALTSIAIPAGVTSIGDSAFSGCEALTSVHITDIEKWCNISFADLNSNPMSNGADLYLNGKLVTSLTMPNTVTGIGDGVFRGCSSLKKVTIPNGVTSIGDRAFQSCTSLTSITIPDSVTSIGESSFSGCALKRITIPSSVTVIGDYAFFGCTALTSITVEDGNPVYHSSGNCLIETGSKTLVVGSSTSVIPDDGSVTNIGERSFHGCALERIVIPSSVTNIGDNAFCWCKSLKRITVEDGNPVYHSSGNCLIKTASKTLIEGSDASVIPDDGSVTNIGDLAFSGRPLKSIVIPSRVTSIGNVAFQGCTSLTSVTIPDSVTSIGNGVFNMCEDLTNIYYSGTIDQWNAIDKGRGWDATTGDYVIHCTDGDITK